MKLLIFATHPIQYQIPIFQALAKRFDLTVIYMLNSKAEKSLDIDFNTKFKWDIPLFEGYDFDYAENISPSPSSSKFYGIKLKNLQSIFAKYNPDKVLVSGWFPYGMIQVIRYCSKHNIEILCRGDSNLIMTSNPLKKIVKEIYIRWIFSKIDKFLVVGTLNKQFYKHYGVRDERLFNGYHCINTPYFKRAFEESTKLKSKKISIGFVGKFIEKKRPLDILKAVEIMRFKNQVQVVFIGEGRLKKDLQDFAKEKSIPVTFTGFLNQSEMVPSGYQQIDVLVLPSIFYETWGLVVNEAMTGGIPAILSNKVGCWPDLIEEGETGYTFANKNYRELSQRLDDFVIKYREGFDFKSKVLKKISHYSMDNTVLQIQSALNSNS